MAKLNAKAEKVFALKYATKKTKGWQGKCMEIASQMAEASLRYGKSPEEVEKIKQEYFEALFDLKFIPGGRIIANSGTGIKNLGNCISGDTKVYTLEKGLINMKDVEVGNHVITHENRFRKVLKIWSNGNKETLVFHKGRNNSQKISISATKEHLVFSENGWVEIGDSKNVRLLQPILLSDSVFPDTFQYSINEENYAVEDTYIYKINKHFGKMGSSGIVGKYDRRFNPVYKNLYNSDDLAYLFGLYLSEGGISKDRRLYFTFSSKEKHLIKRVKEISVEMFGIDPFVQQSSAGNWVQVSIYSEIICDLFLDLFGKGFNNKRIPEWVFSSPISYAENFLKGIVDGDGHTKKSGVINLILANPTLVYESTLLARYCGFSSSFIYDNKNLLSKNDTSKCGINVDDSVEFLNCVGSSFEEVFDMEVEEDHSFVAGDVICHNCFVLGIDDSRESIYGTLKDAAEVFADGGGIGYFFGNIREEGAEIKTTGGQASGALSFMTLFDQTGEVISQASRRG